MKKRRINYPAFSAWAIGYTAGALVVRHNHTPVRSGRRLWEGGDIWLDGRYLGAVGSRLPESWVGCTANLKSS